MTETYCLNCQHWQRDIADRVVGLCRKSGFKPVYSWRLQFEGECCKAYRKSRLTREPHRDTALAARDKRYAYYIPVGGV